MNRYSLFIKTGNKIYKFIIFAEDSKEFVTSIILETQKNFKYENPADLMDYVCDIYGWKWEHFSPDIEFEM